VVLSIINRNSEGRNLFVQTCENGARILWSLDIVVLSIINREVGRSDIVVFAVFTGGRMMRFRRCFRARGSDNERVSYFVSSFRWHCSFGKVDMILL